jgi:hypothetical protein
MVDLASTIVSYRSIVAQAREAGLDGTADFALYLLREMTRASFQDRHGFEEWDEVWETLFTVETGMRRGMENIVHGRNRIAQ